MNRYTTPWLIVLLTIVPTRADPPAATWKNPLVKKGYLNSPLVETTPFVFRDRLYLAENYQAFVDSAEKKLGADSHKDCIRIRDLDKDEIVSIALREHTFGTVLVWKDRAYAFASKYVPGKPWRTCTSVSMTSSVDLLTWTKPQTVLEAEPGEQIFVTLHPSAAPFGGSGGRLPV